MWTFEGSGKPALFVDIPKTASKSTARMFGAVRMTDSHDFLTEPMPGYFVFTIVRNPWTRIESIWNHLSPEIEFEAFVMDYDLDHWREMHPGPDPLGALNRLPQVCWVENAQVDAIYRFEDLEAAWADLQDRGYCRGGPRHVNCRPRKPPIWTAAMIERVAADFRRDLDWFGYHPDVRQA